MLARRTRGIVVAASALLVLGAASTGARAQLMMKAPASQADRDLLETASKRLSTCFTTVGIKGKFEPARELPAASKLLAIALLPASGPVLSDGYAYWIALHESRVHIYVRQVGGFAGAQTLFGPIDVNAACG